MSQTMAKIFLMASAIKVVMVITPERDYRVAALSCGPLSSTTCSIHRKSYAEQRREQPLMTSNVFHSLLDLAGIEYPDQKLTKSWVSPQWRPSSRILQQGLDFDVTPTIVVGKL